uniref:Secreted protein n=1 Tax=Romanomermis culicivorax TaxID=13658 RepID=A0A915KKC0_ROMCU
MFVNCLSHVALFVGWTVCSGVGWKQQIRDKTSPCGHQFFKMSPGQMLLHMKNRQCTYSQLTGRNFRQAIY